MTYELVHAPGCGYARAVQMLFYAGGMGGECTLTELSPESIPGHLSTALLPSLPILYDNARALELAPRLATLRYIARCTGTYLMGGSEARRGWDEARGDALAEVCSGWLSARSSPTREEGARRCALLQRVMGAYTRGGEGETHALTYGDLLAWHAIEAEVGAWGEEGALEGCSPMMPAFLASMRGRKGLGEFLALRPKPVAPASPLQQTPRPPTSSSTTTVAVTGVNGFIGSWVVKTLLESGYTVHGTVRSISNPQSYGHLLDFPGAGGSEGLGGALEEAGKTGVLVSGRLCLFPADLLGGAEGFQRAFQGCTSLIHVASPYDVSASKEDLVAPTAPSIAGTLSVLRAAEGVASLTRVVLTSSAAAVYVTRAPVDHVYSGADWSDEGLLAENKNWYALGKTLAEKGAWEFVGSQRHAQAREALGALPLSLATICPTQTLGPLLEPRLNQSSLFLAEFCNGAKGSMPAKGKCLVDVRDVAMAHVLALKGAPRGMPPPPAQERYLLIAGSMPWKAIGGLLSSHLPPEAPVPTTVDAGPPSYPQALHSTLATHLLGVKYRPMEESIADSAASFLEFDLLPGVMGEGPMHTLTQAHARRLLGKCAPMGFDPAEVAALGPGPTVSEVSSYRVPLLAPGGGCSISGKLHPDPFPIVNVLGEGEGSAAAEALLVRLKSVCNSLSTLPGMDWVGVYQVVPPITSLGEPGSSSLYATALAQGGSATASNLLKLAYVGAPSRPYFPLTPEFAAGSNNSTVGMQGVTVVIHDTRALPQDAPYYTCDGKVRAEVCTPIWGGDGGIIGIVDAESFSKDAFRDRGVLAAVLHAAQVFAGILEGGEGGK